mgnify:CR=1 FL=1
MVTRYVVIFRVVRDKWRLSAGLLALLSLSVLGACGDDDSDDRGNGVSIADAKRVSAIPAGAPLIDQDNLAFIPKELTVPAGGTVYLKNSEAAVHTVTIEGKNVSGVMREEDLLAWIAPGAGTYRVTCDYHPQMRATISVE